MSMNIVMLGPPGAGKGTQAERISATFGWKQISTGDIFRAALADGTPLGLEAKKYMEAGELVPDEIVEGIVAERLKEPDLEDGFVLDGFPRNLHQAKALDRMLEENGSKIDLVINIAVDTETLVRRLSGRRVCKKCGANFHVLFNPPSKAGICDNCGGDLYQREDDNEETVRRRLKVYEEQTEPVVSYYKPSGRLVSIDGTGAPDEVFMEIQSAINKFSGGATT